NKAGQAFRKGIYLSRVQRIDAGVDSPSSSGTAALRFNLLRGSSNLDGPTDNFRATDHEIVDGVQAVCDAFFEQSAELSHVLAQAYENTAQGKARIKAHSDKTKDMPRYGLIAFCTFSGSYRGGRFDPEEVGSDLRRSAGSDAFDHLYRG